MAGTDWDKEMKKIDKQLESISDDALIPTSSAKAPAEQAKIADKIAGYPAIAMSKMSPEIQAKFKAADANNLRPGYFPDHNSDINNQWDQNVPGK